MITSSVRDHIYKVLAEAKGPLRCGEIATMVAYPKPPDNKLRDLIKHHVKAQAADPDSWVQRIPYGTGRYAAYLWRKPEPKPEPAATTPVQPWTIGQVLDWALAHPDVPSVCCTIDGVKFSVITDGAGLLLTA